MKPKLASQQLVTESLAWLARGLLFCLLIVAPWPYGMALWASQVWLVPVIGVIFLLAMLVAFSRRISVGNPIVWSLTAILVVGLIQTIPLPQSLWQTLAPSAGFETQIQQLATEFGDSSTPEPETQTQPAPATADRENPAADTLAISHHTISISPEQTRATLCVMAQALALLISATLLFRDRTSVFALFCTMSVSGLAISLLGIYQAVVAGDWTFLNVQSTSFATFYSRNSAPQFLACSFAAAGGMLAIYRSVKPSTQDKRYQLVYPSVNFAAKLRRRIDDFVTDADLFSAVSLMIMAVFTISVFTANSRGGILSFMASVVLVGLVFSLGKQAGSTAMLGVLALLTAAGLFLAFFGLDDVIGARLDTLSAEAYRLDNVRLELWRMAASQASFWGLGSGLGTFHFAILPTYQHPQSTWYYHAENVYIELASDTGIVILLVALAGLLWLLGQLITGQVQSTTAKAARFACLFAGLAIGLHNLVDFSLILPSVFVPMASLTGAYLGTRHTRRSRVRVAKPEPERPASKAATSRMANGERRVKTSLTQTSESPIAEASATDREPWNPQTLIVCTAVIVCCVLLGFRPLRAFAFAEQLRVEPEPAQSVASDETSALFESAQQSRWSHFPETQFKIGKLLQQQVQQELEFSPRWPAEVNESMRVALSRPEFFTAAFHESSDTELQSLREFLQGEPLALDELTESHTYMQNAIIACPYDWRANWGLMRSDLGELSSAARRANYARILLTCRNNQPVMQAAATHALMVGETKAGLRFWQELLPVSPQARTQVLNLLDRYLTLEQFLTILPESWLQRLEMAVALSRTDRSAAAQAVLETVDLDEAYSQAHYASDWPLIAWGAQRTNDIGLEIDAWKQATLDDPRNHAYGYSLALAYQKADRTAEALQAIDEALHRAPSNATYQALRKQLESQP